MIAIEQDGDQAVIYAEGKIENQNFLDETWRYASSAKHQSIAASSIRLDSNALQILGSRLQLSRNKTFLRYQAQAYLECLLINAYNAEGIDFKKAVKTIPLAAVPLKASVNFGHTIYNIKVNDDQKLKLKARIAPHGK